MIDGCLDWQANGLVRPTSVIDATKNYFEEEDLLSQWLQDECDAEPGNNFKWESVARLFENWTNYCVSCGERPDSSKSFSTQLAKRGFERCKKQKVRSFSGLRLLRPPIIGGTD
jgi:putative DNA primase/helicase